MARGLTGKNGHCPRKVPRPPARDPRTDHRAGPTAAPTDRPHGIHGSRSPGACRRVSSVRNGSGALPAPPALLARRRAPSARTAGDRAVHLSPRAPRLRTPAAPGPLLPGPSPAQPLPLPSSTPHSRLRTEFRGVDHGGSEQPGGTAPGTGSRVARHVLRPVGRLRVESRPARHRPGPGGRRRRAAVGGQCLSAGGGDADARGRADGRCAGPAAAAGDRSRAVRGRLAGVRTRAVAARSGGGAGGAGCGRGAVRACRAGAAHRRPPRRTARACHRPGTRCRGSRRRLRTVRRRNAVRGPVLAGGVLAHRAGGRARRPLGGPRTGVPRAGSPFVPGGT